MTSAAATAMKNGRSRRRTSIELTPKIMLISGIQKFSMIDFPRRLSCVVFLPGCNLRCGFCHNPEFVLPEEIKKIRKSFISEETFFNFLDKRKGMLDGVVISGGEPTVSPELSKFIKKIKEKGFQVKLDTNGGSPEILSRIMKDGLIDYIAMDMKTSPDEYARLAGTSVNGEKIKRSIELVKESGIEYEFRSTLIREIHSENILNKMAKALKGATNLYLQQFRSAHTLDPKFSTLHPFSEDEMTKIAVKFFAKSVQKVNIRL